MLEFGVSNIYFLIFGAFTFFILKNGMFNAYDRGDRVFLGKKFGYGFSEFSEEFLENSLLIGFDFTQRKLKYQNFQKKYFFQYFWLFCL